MVARALVVLVVVTLSLVTIGCGASPPKAETAASRDAVGHVLDDWHAAAAHADENAYFAAFADDAMFLGTDGTERWDVAAFRAYAHPHFAKGKAWSFRSTRRTIHFAPGGDVAWFEEDLDTPNLGPARGSGVLVRQNGVYKIAQYNLSVPIPNERFDAVRRIIAGGQREVLPSSTP
jgi:hypothetical protein